MNLKNHQKLFHFIQKNTILERDGNIITISKEEEIPVHILYPENFPLEKKAVEQLLNFAQLKTSQGNKMKCACAMPDFHQGENIPIGSVVVSEKDIVIPSAIGTDINCGMRMHHTGLKLDQFLQNKKKIIELLKGDLLEGTRNIPTTQKSMEAMFLDGLGAFWKEIKNRPEGIFQHIDYQQVEKEIESLHSSSFLRGNLEYAPENLMNRSVLRDPNLGTLGGGNHFFEFQVIQEIKDKKRAFELGLHIGDVVYTIHTGSRDVGFYVGRRWMDIAKENYPKGIKHPKHHIYMLEGEKANQYLQAMQSASHYATVNRALIAEMARQRIFQIFSKDINNHCIVDVPHNIVIQEQEGNVHRKGSTPAYENQLLVIPGSMGDFSYLLKGLGNEKWQKSSSHGAGRKLSRSETFYEFKKDPQKFQLDKVECITLKEERKIEESPGAYKDISQVIQSQVEEKMIDIIAVFSPLVTFKA